MMNLMSFIDLHLPRQEIQSLVVNCDRFSRASMVQNRNVMEPNVDNFPEFKICDFVFIPSAFVQLNRKKNFSNGD